MSKSKARKLAEFLRNLTDDAKINTSAVQQDNVVTSRTDLESKANDTEALVTAASVTSYVSNELGEYVHSTHDIPLTFTGDVTGSGTITDMGATSFNLTLDAETLPSQTGHSGKFLTTNGTVASWASLNITNWNTAYSWGNHADAGYLTSYTETDTFQSVTARGAVTNQNITIQNNTPSIILVDTETSNPSNQSIRIQHDGIDSNLPSGEGLALRIDSTDTSGTNTNTCIITSGELYANNTQKVWHAGNFNPSDYLLTSNYTNTTYNINAQDVSGGKAIRLTGSDGSTDDVTFAAGSNVTLTRSGDTITIASTDTNTDTNTTDWYVANSAGTNQFKVDKNEKVRFEGSGATSVSFDAATNKVTIGSTDTNTETTTTLTKVGNELRYVNEAGTTQTIDLSLYLDDTNLARILSGTMNSSGVATFTRDDSTTFTVDMSVLLDDTNLSRIVSASWNTSNGVLTLTRNDSTTVSVDLDNRYLTSYTETDTLQTVTNRGNTTSQDIFIGGASKTGTTLTIDATDTSGAPAMTSKIMMRGYEGRGKGIFFEDISYGDAEWFAGVPYSAQHSVYQIGFNSTNQSEYRANYVFDVDNLGNARVKNNLTVGGNISGNIDYSNITNPPVIDNSVDYINAASFNTSTGVLTLSGVGRAGATVDLDNRYSLGSHNHDDRYVRSDYINSGYDWNTFSYGSNEAVIARVESSASNPPASGVWNWSLYQQGDSTRGSQIAVSAYAGGNRMYLRTSNGSSGWNNWDRVFADNYHPNADKWTTARTHTVTLTGQVTGSASQTVDGTGNRTWTISTTLNDSALDDQYVTVGSRHTGDASGLVQSNKASIRIWDVSTSTDKPSGAADGLVLSAGWDSSGWGVQQYHDFHTNDLYLRSKQNGTFSSWDKVFHDTYHPNADKWTNTRTNTVTLTGDVTGSGSASVDGTGNWTVSVAADLTVASTDTFTGTYPIAWLASDNLYKSTWLTINGATDTLNTRNINANGTVTATNFVGSINYNQITNPPVIDNSVDYINGASFNTSTGVLTLSGVGRAGATVDLDNRYLTGYTETDTLQSVTSRGNNTNTNINIIRNVSGAKLLVESTATSGQAGVDFKNPALHSRLILDDDDLLRVFNQTSGFDAMSLKSDGSLVIKGGQPFTRGGRARLSIFGGLLAIGDSNNDMSYIRKQGTAQFCWQTSNGNNAGNIQLQPYGGNVIVGSTSGVGKLHINTGSGTGDANTVFVDRAGTSDYSGISFATAGSVDWSIGQNSIGGFSIYENGLASTTRLTVKDGGNVGMGGLNPQSNLSVLTDINYDPPALGSHGSNFSILKKDGVESGAYGLLVGVTGSGDGWIQAQRTSEAATAYKLRLQPSGGNVTIGGSINHDTRSSYYWLPDPDGTGTYSSHRFGTNHGYIDIGPKNTTYAHMDTDRSKFYFNKRVLVDEGIISSFNEDLYLRRAESSDDQIHISTTTTTISQDTVIQGNLTVNGSIAQADGFGTLYTFNTTQGLSTSWADVTAIAGNALPTGTYAIQIFINNSDVGGNSYSEYYSGTMSWYGSGTNDNDWNEIPLHNAGHAQNGPLVYARTLRRSQSTMILQLAASGTVGSDGIQIKLRRLI